MYCMSVLVDVSLEKVLVRKCPMHHWEVSFDALPFASHSNCSHMDCRAVMSIACTHDLSVFSQVVDGAEWLYKEPLLPPEAVSRMSRQVEGRSRAMGPSSKL